MSIDVDYYSATMAALQVFDAESSTRHPRVLIYADDIFGYHDLTIMSADVGEERAFTDFNDAHPSMQIALCPWTPPQASSIPPSWNEKVFALHDFDHPLYNEPINPVTGARAEDLLGLAEPDIGEL